MFWKPVVGGRRGKGCKSQAVLNINSCHLVFLLL